MSKEDQTTSSSLFNAFSFDEIINIFNEIDKNIISLHQCSSDDFLGLNKQFRKLHAESKTISDNAQNVLDVITRDKTLEALRNLKILKEQLKNQICHVELFLQNNAAFINTGISDFESALLSLRNLRQNLMTNKFLLANLKLEASCKNIHGQENERGINDVYASTENIIAGIHENEKILLELKKILVDHQNKMADLSSENCTALESCFKSITNKINELVDIRQNALMAIPRLKQMTEDSSANVSQIITNLQYHDIIKQKMDHIQLTHQNLINELGDLGKKDQPGEKHLHAKIFLKIRDIAGLQAAQLIHANKAYQNAIKEIITSLTGTGERMAEISQLCNQFVSKPELFEVLNEKELQLHLEKLSEQVYRDKNYIKELSGSVGGALQKIQDVEDGHLVLSVSITTLSENIKIIIERFQAINKNETQQGIDEIKTLISESEHLILVFGETVKNLNGNLHSINEIQSTFIEGRSGYLDKLYKITDDLLCARSKNISDKLITLQSNIREGSEITCSIRKSIDDVKYYDFFENVIEEIIDELNNINFKLRFIDAESRLCGRDENLAQLKTRYTMDSEHKIHDSYASKSSSAIAITSINIDENNGEDDNIELF
jgi:hypothetical protein